MRLKLFFVDLISNNGSCLMFVSLAEKMKELTIANKIRLVIEKSTFFSSIK